MQGKILDFSIQTSSGIISGNDQKRYRFTENEWKEQSPPKRGMNVDFEINTRDEAIAIYLTLSHPSSLDKTYQQFHEKNEIQYSPFRWFLKCLRNYANFTGRAKRQEYWFFMLFYVLGILIAMFIDDILNTKALFYGLYLLAMFMPQTGVTIRRLHDIGKSGWWYLISLFPIIGIIFLIIWLAKESDPHPNQYGLSTQ